MARFIMILVLGSMVTFGINNINQNVTISQGSQNSIDSYSLSRSHSIANSMGDILLMRLANDFDYRVNSKETESLYGGTVEYVVEDAFFEGDSIVKITVASEFEGVEKMLTLYTANPTAGWVPPVVRGAWTANGLLDNTISDMFIDGRDHDLNLNLIPETGVYGVSTSIDFVNTENAAIGGTNNKVDYPMTFPEVPEVIEENYNWGGQFPLSPDEALGLPEGTLKEAAKTGEYGSQYLINPPEVKIGKKNFIAGLTYPISGITYIEITNGHEYEFILLENDNKGILIFHNDDRTSRVKGVKYDIGTSDGVFKGLLISDYSFHHHIDILGSIIMLSPNLEESKSCNGNKDHWAYYSSEAIGNATETVAAITGFAGSTGYGFGRKRLNVKYVYE